MKTLYMIARSLARLPQYAQPNTVMIDTEQKRLTRSRKRSLHGELLRKKRRKVRLTDVRDPTHPALGGTGMRLHPNALPQTADIEY